MIRIETIVDDDLGIIVGVFNEAGECTAVGSDWGGGKRRNHPCTVVPVTEDPA